MIDGDMQGLTKFSSSAFITRSHHQFAITASML